MTTTVEQVRKLLERRLEQIEVEIRQIKRALEELPRRTS